MNIMLLYQISSYVLMVNLNASSCPDLYICMWMFMFMFA